MVKIAVIGSRSFNAYVYFCDKLEHLIQNIKEEIEFYSGGAKGADSLIKRYCEEKGYKITEFLPEYDKYPPKVAPLKRNHQIVEAVDMLVAFTTGSSGTAYTINLAKEKQIPIRIIKI
jgi:hypothetical protein|nr:MAG TPA: Protein of unknown function (DUF2493) [Caudoviricetes sp.]